MFGSFGYTTCENKIYQIEIIKNRRVLDTNHDIWLEIIAPHIKYMEIIGMCSVIRIEQRNVASLVYAILRLNFDFEDEESNLDVTTCLVISSSRIIVIKTDWVDGSRDGPSWS